MGSYSISAQLKYWFSKINVPLWINVERALSLTTDLIAFLMSEFWKLCDAQALSPSIQVSLQAWGFLLSYCHTDISKVENQSPLCLLEGKIPILSVKLLPTYGITTIQESMPKSAERLIRKWESDPDTIFTDDQL